VTALFGTLAALTSKKWRATSSYLRQPIAELASNIIGDLEADVEPANLPATDFCVYQFLYFGVSTTVC